MGHDDICSDRNNNAGAGAANSNHSNWFVGVPWCGQCSNNSEPDGVIDSLTEVLVGSAEQEAAVRSNRNHGISNGVMSLDETAARPEGLAVPAPDNSGGPVGHSVCTDVSQLPRWLNQATRPSRGGEASPVPEAISSPSITATHSGSNHLAELSLPVPSQISDVSDLPSSSTISVAPGRFTLPPLELLPSSFEESSTGRTAGYRAMPRSRLSPLGEETGTGTPVADIVTDGGSRPDGNGVNDVLPQQLSCKNDSTLLVPAADETAAQQKARRPRPKSVAIALLGIDYNGMRALEGLASMIEILIAKERIVEAHAVYAELTRKLTELFEANDLSVYTLLRPRSFLTSLHHRLGTRAQVNVESSSSSAASDSSSVSDRPGPKKKLRRRRYFRAWGRTASTAHRRERREDTGMANPVGLGRLLSRRLDRMLSKQRSSSGSIELTGTPCARGTSSSLFERSYQAEGIARDSIEHCTASLGVAVLCEPHMLLPPVHLGRQSAAKFNSGSTSEQANNSSSEVFASMAPPDENNLAREKQFALHTFAETVLGTAPPDKAQRVPSAPPRSPVPSKGHDSLYGGRELLARLVWPLEALPCLAFTAKSTSSEIPLSNTAGQHPYSWDQTQVSPAPCSTGAGVLPPSAYKYTYACRCVGGLSMPADIQVVFHSHRRHQRHSLSSDPGQPLLSSDDRANEPNSEGESSSEGIRNSRIWVMLHELLERLVNNPHIHRMRIQYCETLTALAILESKVLQDKTWNYYNTKDYNIAWKQLTNGSAICITEGWIATAVFQVLCLVNECDLHSNWIPFLSSAATVQQVSSFAQVIRQSSALPWPLHDRENVLFGYAIDVLSSSSASIVMNGKSVPDAATSLFGLTLPTPGPGTTRMQVQFFTFQLTPDSEIRGRTKVKFVILVDPRMSFIPKTVQSYVARQTAARLFSNIQKLCQNFSGSIYEQRVKSNPQVYGLVQSRLDEYYAQRRNPEESSIAHEPI